MFSDSLTMPSMDASTSRNNLSLPVVETRSDCIHKVCGKSRRKNFGLRVETVIRDEDVKVNSPTVPDSPRNATAQHRNVFFPTSPRSVLLERRFSSLSDC